MGVAEIKFPATLVTYQIMQMKVKVFRSNWGYNSLT